MLFKNQNNKIYLVRFKRTTVNIVQFVAQMEIITLIRVSLVLHNVNSELKRLMTENVKRKTVLMLVQENILRFVEATEKPIGIGLLSTSIRYNLYSF